MRGVEGLVVNKAFFEACARAGVEPPELQPLAPKAFRRVTDEVQDDKVLQIRYEGYEKVKQHDDAHAGSLRSPFFFDAKMGHEAWLCVSQPRWDLLLRPPVAPCGPLWSGALCACS